jgi:Tfp pilus assembly protein PilX
LKRRNRGFLIILALFLIVLITVTGLGLVQGGTDEYRKATLGLANQQALALAMSGLEDARLKLERDPNFPPDSGAAKFYSYGEDVTNVGSTTSVGNFEVTIDSTYAETPYLILILNSTGRCKNANKEVKRCVRTELDLSLLDRDPLKATDPNPQYFQFVNLAEVP